MDAEEGIVVDGEKVIKCKVCDLIPRGPPTPGLSVQARMERALADIEREHGLSPGLVVNAINAKRFRFPQ